MYLKGQHKRSQAFALPTVLIASVVLLMVLAVSVTATAAVRTALKNQYYVQLAQVAGESGVAYAKACLAANGNIPQWTNANPLTPATDCSGNVNIGPSVNALVVGGGGSGGGAAGGGGAGGYLSSSVVVGATSYPVAVGNGGAATVNGAVNGNVGASSSFANLNAIGGGYGAPHGGNTGGNGGSGGGGGMTTGGGGGNRAGGVGSQGYNGGAGYADPGTSWTGNNGGGGGAGGVGGVGGNSPGSAAGGAGVANSITGSALFYAAGGGGGEINGSYVGTGGSGIGGSGTVDSIGTAGAPNTGSGGGGGSYSGPYWSGGAGGSGVVVISYPSSSGIVATGGTITTSGGNKIHQFTTPGTFSVSSVGSANCPSDPRCFVMVSGNVRSSFSVPKPAVDGTTGQAITIANNGYVEVTRTSNGSVWRSYKQPSVQPAVVPDLCSGNATSARGWNAAVKTTQQDSLASASSAQTISLADGAINAGVMYFRRDFSIGLATSYDLNVYTSSAQDNAVTYIDGQRVSSTAGSLDTEAVSLGVGCHSAVVQLTNKTVKTRPSEFTASLTRSGAVTPIFVTNTNWRVSTGDSVHYSNTNYYADPTVWTSARDISSAVEQNSNWSSTSGDMFARWIATTHGLNAGTYPAGYSYYRDSRDFILSTTTTVKVSSFCDDQCNIYIDGQTVANGNNSQISAKNIILTPGAHRIAVSLYNAGTTPNPSGTAISVVRTSDNTLLTHTDNSWVAANFWEASPNEYYSTDQSFLPFPNTVKQYPSLDLLAVAGGGGGGMNAAGGGGGGGTISTSFTLTTTATYAVTIGSGGAGAPNATVGSNGTNTVFGSYVAYGGGGGSSRDSGAGPGSGGTGGGGAGATATSRYIGGGAVAGQGGTGGNGTTPDPGCGATGGGGGGSAGNGNLAAASGSSGNGGAGVISYLTGVPIAYSGGGAGGITCAGSASYGAATAGGGNSQTNYSGVANTGGGGGGGGPWSGSGASGVVVIRFKTGSLTASCTSGCSTTNWNGYTIMTFTTNGSFMVTAIP